MYRDLLVHVDGSSAGRRRLQFAKNLAHRTGARLSGLHVTPAPDVPLKFKPSQIARAASEIALKLDSDARLASALFMEETGQHAEGSCWFEAAGDVVEAISEYARYTDLVIVGQYEWQAPLELHPLPIAHSLSLQCGRPVLVVPSDVQSHAFDRAAIAWDGSREAVRAVHDALAFLRLLRSLDIVEIVGPSAESSGTDAEHLANHGIAVGADISGAPALPNTRRYRSWWNSATMICWSWAATRNQGGSNCSSVAPRGRFSRRRPSLFLFHIDRRDQYQARGCSLVLPCQRRQAETATASVAASERSPMTSRNR